MSYLRHLNSFTVHSTMATSELRTIDIGLLFLVLKCYRASKSSTLLWESYIKRETDCEQNMHCGLASKYMKHILPAKLFINTS